MPRWSTLYRVRDEIRRHELGESLSIEWAVKREMDREPTSGPTLAVCASEDADLVGEVLSERYKLLNVK